MYDVCVTYANGADGRGFLDQFIVIRILVSLYQAREGLGDPVTPISRWN